MSDDQFDHLIERYLMGQAYKAITAEMGSNPQLIAFVNYDKVDQSGYALESLSVDDQHALILSNIDSDTALELACESFSSKIASIAERFKNAITFNRHDNLNDLHEGTLEEKASKIRVIKAAHFDQALGYIKEAEAALKFVLSKIPKGSGSQDWEKFYQDHLTNAESGQLGKYISQTKRNRQIFKETNKSGDFEGSGWTAAKFKTAIAALGSAQVAFANHKAVVDDTCEHMYETLHLIESSKSQIDHDDYKRRRDVHDSIENASKKKDDPTKKDWLEDTARKSVNELERQSRLKQHNALMKMVPAHVLKAMKRAADCVDETTSLIVTIEHWMYRSLVDVSRHYELKN